jgi:hypothetical protein
MSTPPSSEAPLPTNQSRAPEWSQAITGKFWPAVKHGQVLELGQDAKRFYPCSGRYYYDMNDNLHENSYVTVDGYGQEGDKFCPKKNPNDNPFHIEGTTEFVDGDPDDYAWQNEIRWVRSGLPSLVQKSDVAGREADGEGDQESGRNQTIWDRDQEETVEAEKAPSMTA